MTTKAERQFRTKYPNTRVVIEPGTVLPTYAVYAGDYLCAESWERGRAFKVALAWEEAGYIQPDAHESATTEGRPA